ncbi:MAG: cation:proton antiporter [Prevotellaceae bacterium]|jgi:Kef-type K+ transport system membrane component KefB/nucleotide-binding universal stress UspA family protein|nr:cation:proton antiporter [Prevotellaceae bacterium]
MDWFRLPIELPITDPTWIFLLVLLIILFAPILLNRLRIPHVVGMILAGVLIGEHGLNILARDSSFELFGKVGLYYIMFLAGLEMDMADFKKNRVKVGILGVLTFIIPMTMGLAANIWVLGFGFLTALLLASMYASHTLVSYPIVIRYGLSRQRSVSIAVGSTAVTDTLTLLVLAVVSGMFKGDTSSIFLLWLIVKFLVLGGLMIFIFPRVGRWFFRRYDDAVMQFIFVLSMVFLGAGLMELIGMEGILGAFLSGLVLNRLIPHVSPLMNHLEFVGNALFIPYFLIGVGMLIDMEVIFGPGDALKVAGVMIVVSLVSKWVAVWMLQKGYRMKALERKLMYGLSSARAAATLAAVLVGYNIILPDGSRLLNEDILNGTILLILVTCIVSSIVTDQAARKMAMAEALLEADKKPSHKERILIPVANPDTIEYLMNLALLVRDPKQPDNLLALSVVNDNNDSKGTEVSGKRCLSRAAKIVASAGVSLRQISRYDLNIASGIIHTAKENDVTDVIIGLHRKSHIVDSFFGSLSENLLKGLHREVMIAKFIIPVNTVHRIIIAVPPKAEYEAGFSKWVQHFCRIGAALGCRVHFYAPVETTAVLQRVVRLRHPQTRADYSLLEHWDDLLLLTGQVGFDDLLVLITSRRGSISYDNSFESLPSLINRYFSNNSLVMVYPDQLGDPEELTTFAGPLVVNKGVRYEKLGEWVYRWFKKS